MYRKIFSLLLAVMLMTLAVGCTSNGATTNEAASTAEATTPVVEETAAEEEDTPQSGGTIILSTTTSTENSGLLAYILPDFTEKTGIEVKVVAVGTGKALQMGRDGEADVLLVHAKPDELIFVEEGHGVSRNDVMYNDFVITGPKDDPAGLKEAGSDVLKALSMISESGSKFVSRGDDSGTNKMEIKLWSQIPISTEGDWYIQSGQGMGATLEMCDELGAYTLTDRATYLSMKNNLDQVILLEGDEKLFNQYGVIPVDPNKNEMINSEGANKFVQWILSDETQALIGEFGKEEFGQPLFIPNGN